MGRKTFSATNINKATQSVRAAGRAAKEYSDVGRADETVEMVDQQLQELNAQFEAEVAALDTKIDPATEDFRNRHRAPQEDGDQRSARSVGMEAILALRQS